jgi:hypothetical protein
VTGELYIGAPKKQWKIAALKIKYKKKRVIRGKYLGGMAEDPGWQFEERTSAAEAALGVSLTARLKPCPYENRL